MAVEIKNLKYQPLTFHLANSKKSVHLQSRGKVVIEDRDVSAEMRKARDKRFIALREVRTAPTVPPQAHTSSVEVKAASKPEAKPLPASKYLGKQTKKDDDGAQEISDSADGQSKIQNPKNNIKERR